VFDGLRSYICRHQRSILLVDGGSGFREDVVTLYASDNIQVASVTSPDAALDRVSTVDYDCVVIDIAAAPGQGLDLVERVRACDGCADIPIVAYTEAPAGEAEEERLEELGRTGTLRRARSTDALLQEIALVLHLPGYDSLLLSGANTHKDPYLAGRKVLVIDDDFRNIFALTSALEQQDMEVVYAETGRDGIDLLQARADIDIALIDVMMPELDGYDTMREIRKIDELAALPLIAVTAKAMKGDREKCMEAGASDYLAKPVDIERLLSMLRVWLYK